GRMFTQADDRKGAEPVVVMSYATWQQKYGLDPTVIGASFSFNGFPFTVIGVAPPKFYGDRMESSPAFWIPLHAEAMIDGPGNLLQFGETDWLDIIGRLAPGADPKSIETQMQLELRQWLLGPESKLQPGERALVPKQTLHLSPGGAGVQMMRDEYQSGLHLLMWVSGFVLLIACANVAAVGQRADGEYVSRFARGNRGRGFRVPLTPPHLAFGISRQHVAISAM